MEKINKDVHDHLDTAKDELKSAVAGAFEDAKDKLNEVVGNVAESVGKTADKIEHEVKKAEPEIK